MNLEKLFYTIGTAFFAVFLMCAALVLTNKLNMWMVGILSLLVSIVAFVIMQILHHKSKK